MAFQLKSSIKIHTTCNHESCKGVFMFVRSRIRDGRQMYSVFGCWDEFIDLKIVKRWYFFTDWRPIRLVFILVRNNEIQYWATVCRPNIQKQSDGCWIDEQKIVALWSWGGHCKSSQWNFMKMFAQTHTECSAIFQCLLLLPVRWISNNLVHRHELQSEQCNTNLYSVFLLFKPNYHGHDINVYSIIWK